MRDHSQTTIKIKKVIREKLNLHSKPYSKGDSQRERSWVG